MKSKSQGRFIIETDGSNSSCQGCSYAPTDYKAGVKCVRCVVCGAFCESSNVYFVGDIPGRSAIALTENVCTSEMCVTRVVGAMRDLFKFEEGREWVHTLGKCGRLGADGLVIVERSP